MMKVKELKELLGKADDNADVWIADGVREQTENYYDVYTVKQIQDLTDPESKAVYIYLNDVFE